jgi:hypothetical protein
VHRHFAHEIQVCAGEDSNHARLVRLVRHFDLGQASLQMDGGRWKVEDGRQETEETSISRGKHGAFLLDKKPVICRHAIQSSSCLFQVLVA